MPTITHALITGAVAILFFLLTQDSLKRFKAEHVIIFGLNGFLGPDWPKLLSPFFGSGYFESTLYTTINGFNHTLVGWLIESFGFGLLYYGIFLGTKEARTQGQAPISYVHATLLVLGAGMNHFGVDMLDYGGRVFPTQLSWDYRIGVAALQTGETWQYGPLYAQLSWFDDKYLLILGVLVLFGLIWLLKNKPVKYAIIVAIGFAAFVLSVIFLTGSVIVANENDLGYMVYIGLAWLFPLFACYWSRDPVGHQKEPAEN